MPVPSGPVAASGTPLTREAARRFLLLHHGLLGPHRFAGRQGVLDFVAQAGCIQYDPIDVCGRNADLVLQSRVKGFTKPLLARLLYEERALLDYFDKNLAIVRAQDWPCLGRYRRKYREGSPSRDAVDSVRESVLAALRERGPLSSADLEHDGLDRKVDWYWSDTRLARAALEALYFRGDLAVHHKRGTVKVYDLAENCIAATHRDAPAPFADDGEYFGWHVLRRIASVGLLWNRASDAWLNIPGLNAAARDRAFGRLLREGRIIPVRVEGIAEALYAPASAESLLRQVLDPARRAPRSRCELLAPLDNLLWDRRLIQALFGFDYKWEIYTPAAARKYGYYVLPVLHGSRMVGRVEALNDRRKKRLVVKNLWFEEGVRRTNALDRALERCLARFARFNGCTDVLR